MRTRLSLTIDDVQPMMTAALQAARDAGRAVSIAIVDDAGVLLDFRRMDGARPHTVEVSQRKARVSAMVGVPTSVIEAMAKDRPVAPDMMVVQGGMPAIHHGDCVGGIGVSGGKPEEDDAICTAGLGALKGG
ncbi:MAG: heme-binding protein [Hyphomonadaceae bacterium]